MICTEHLIRTQLFGNGTPPTTVVDPDRPRLSQDTTSTRVLEALLGTMLVLAALATALLGTDHILPKSPCSIAAVASLLADSNAILQRYSHGLGTETETVSYKTISHEECLLIAVFDWGRLTLASNAIWLLTML